MALNLRFTAPRLLLAVALVASMVVVAFGSPVQAQQGGDSVTKVGPGKARGYEPTSVQVVPGDGSLTVSWTVASRPGFEDDDIFHALRWSQEFGVFHNDPMPRDPHWAGENSVPLPPIHGMLIEPGVSSYTITGLKNRVVTGVHVRSFTHTARRSQEAAESSQWVRVKGPSTTPVADEVIFNSAAYSVAEGGTVNLGLTRYVTAAANLDTSVAVTLATADGTASSSDYTAFSARSVAMASSVAKATSSVVTASDDLVEYDETLSVSLSVPAESVFGAGNPSTATVHITDDDRPKAKVAFGTNAASTAEYTALFPEAVTGGTLNVPVTVSHLPGASTTFAVEVLPGGTAVEGSDFSIATKSVTFGPTDASKTKNVAVALVNDAEYEHDEIFNLRIVAADDPADDLGDYYARDAAGATAEVTVTSEDQRSPTKVYSVGSTASATEGGSAYLTLTLGEATAEPLAFTVSAAYTAGSDKAAASDVGNLSSTTHTVAAGKSSDTISIPIPTDGLVENPETFTVAVTSSDIRWSVKPDGGNTATVTINDNDRATAKIAFGTNAGATSGYAVTVAENLDTGLLSVPISVNHLPATPAIFNVEVLAAGTATEGSDYNLGPKLVTFDASEGSKTQHVRVFLTDDSRWERNETIRLRIVAADDPADDLGDHFARHSSGATAFITVTSDESHFAVASTPSLRVERGKTATYRVRLTDRPTHDVTVTPQGVSKATVSGPLTFTKDDWRSPQEVTVTGVSYGSATISHQISSDDTNFSSLQTESVSVLVTEPTKLYEITAAAAAAEGADAELTVTLSEAAPTDMTFDVAYDYASSTASAADTGSARPTTVTVAKGKTTATLSIPIARDSLVEPAETLKVSIAPGSGVAVAWGKRADGADAATVTINDATIAVSVGQAQFSVGEGDGAVSVPIAFSSATPEEVVLRISAAAGGTATQGVDYRFPSSVTVAQGATAASFSVTILDDSIRERNERLGLRLGVATPGVGYAIGAPGQATVTIADNDTAGVTVSSAGISVRRGSTAAYTVKLNSKPTTTVRIAPTSGDSDTASVSPAFISFSPSDWDTLKTFTVTGNALGSTAIAHRILRSSGDSFYTAGLSIDSVSVTVTTDNLYEISATAAAGEGGNADLTVTLHNAAPAGGLAFTVTPAYATGTGKAAAADVSSVPAVVTVAENQRTAALRIPLARDALVEGDETFTVAIATSAQGWTKKTDSADTATVTITDLTRAVSLAASSYTVGESDGKVTIGLSVSGAHTDTITATLVLADGTAARDADYGGASATAQVIFAPGATTATLNIPISDDELVEGSETFTVTITGVSAGHAVGAGNSATVTIADDEAATVTVTPTSLSVVEFAQSSYAVSLNAKPTANVTITPSSSAKTHADASSAVIFTPTDWETAKTITVTGKQRGSATITHTVTSNDTRFAALTPDPVAVTVTPYAKTYAITPEVTVTEGGSAVLTITLGEPAPRASLEFVLEYAFDSPAAGKADADDISDNLVVGGKRRVVIAGAERQARVGIPVVADDLLGEGGEGDDRLKETFTVSITEVNSGGSPASEWRKKPGGEDTATVTIQDRDVNRAKIAFGADAAATTRYTASVAENVSGGTLSVPVTVSHLPAKSTTFTIEVASTGTATAYQSEQSPGDYRIATKSVTFGPNDASKTKNVVITLTDDDDVEVAETIVLSIAAAANPAANLGDHYARNANGAAATITINSDDVAAGSTKTYSLPASATAAEGANAELTVTLGEDAPAGGVTFNVTYNYSGSAATPRDTGPTPTTLTVEGGARTATLLVPIALDNDEDDAETFAVTVVASTPGWAKAPTGVNTATVTITDATESIDFAGAAYTVIEGESANIVITRTGATDRAAQVSVTAFGRPPLNRGLNYVTKTVTIPAGADAAVVVFPTTDNAAVQARGFAFLSMRTSTLGYVANSGISYLYIQDDDGADYTTTYTMASTASVDEGNNAELAITLGQAAHSDGLSFRVYYDYSAGTATAADLGEVPTTLDVAGGATTATLAIPILADGIDDPDETFVVRITPVSIGGGQRDDFDWALAPSGSASATVTIKNVSGHPTVTLLEDEEEPLVDAKQEQQQPVTLSFGSAAIADVAYTVGAPVPYPHDTTAGQERHKLPAASGAADIAYSATGLPAGLVMGRDRIIRGTPTEATASPATVTYTAAHGEGETAASASLSFQVTVNPPITFDAAELRPFTNDTIEYTVGQDTPVSMVLPEASGGTGTLTYRLGNWHQRQSIGGYVEGFSFDAATRTLTSVVGEGSPATPGRYPLHYWAEDDNGAFAAATTELSVAAAPSLAAVGDKAYTAGGEVSLALPAAIGGSTRIVPLRYSLAPEVPGLSFDPLTRTLSGTVTATGSVAMTYTATDRNGVTATQTFTITVNAGANPPTAAPGSVRAAQVSGSRQAMVFWGEVTGADDYIVQVAAFVDADNDGNPDAGSFPHDFAVTAGPDEAGYEVIVLDSLRTAVIAVPKNGRYAIRVAAVNTDGPGPWTTTTVQVTVSSNSNLSALAGSTSTDGSAFSGVLSLSPTFDGATTAYAATVANGVTHVRLTPTVADTGKAMVQVGPSGSLADAASGSASTAISLDVGVNEITVRVTAYDGITTKDYTVTITRAAV